MIHGYCAILTVLLLLRLRLRLLLRMRRWIPSVSIACAIRGMLCSRVGCAGVGCQVFAGVWVMRRVEGPRCMHLRSDRFHLALGAVSLRRWDVGSTSSPVTLIHEGARSGSVRRCRIVLGLLQMTVLTTVEQGLRISGGLLLWRRCRGCRV